MESNNWVEIGDDGSVVFYRNMPISEIIDDTDMVPVYRMHQANVVTEHSRLSRDTAKTLAPRADGPSRIYADGTIEFSVENYDDAFIAKVTTHGYVISESDDNTLISGPDVELRPERSRVARKMAFMECPPVNIFNSGSVEFAPRALWPYKILSDGTMIWNAGTSMFNYNTRKHSFSLSESSFANASSLVGPAIVFSSGEIVYIIDDTEVSPKKVANIYNSVIDQILSDRII